MKKIIVLLLLIMNLFAMTGCIWLITDPESLPLRYPEEQVVKVEIYDLNQLGAHTGLNVFGHDDEELDIKNLDELLDPIKTLDGMDAKEFYDRLSHLQYADMFTLILAASDPSHGFYGYVVKITYESGDHDIIADGMQSFGDKFRFLYCYAEWDLFIEDYLDLRS